MDHSFHEVIPLNEYLLSQEGGLSSVERMVNRGIGYCKTCGTEVV